MEELDIDIDNNMVMNSSTDIGFDGMITLEPRIEQIGKYEFKDDYESRI